MARKNESVDVVERVQQVWDEASGFALSSFNAYVECEHEGNELWLSFHYQPRGVVSQVQLLREPTSAWAKRLGKQLRRSGYARKGRSDDEVAYERWLRGERQFTAELRRLGELAAGSDASDWPARKPTRAPKSVPRTRAQSAAEVMALVRAVGAPWEVTTLLYTRDVEVETLEGVTVAFTAVALCAPAKRSRVMLILTLRDASGPIADPEHEAVELVKRCVRLTGLRFRADRGHFDRRKTLTAEAALKTSDKILKRLDKLDRA